MKMNQLLSVKMPGGIEDSVCVCVERGGFLTFLPAPTFLISGLPAPPHHLQASQSHLLCHHPYLSSPFSKQPLSMTLKLARELAGGWTPSVDSSARKGRKKGWVRLGRGPRRASQFSL